MTKRKGKRRPGVSAYRAKQPVRKAVMNKQPPSYRRLRPSTIESRMEDALQYWQWGWKPEAMEIAVAEMEACLAKQP